MEGDARQDLNLKFQRSKYQKYNKSRTVHPNDIKFTHENRNTIYSSLRKFQANSSKTTEIFYTLTQIPGLWWTTLQFDTKSPQNNPTQLLSMNSHQFKNTTTKRTKSLALIRCIDHQRKLRKYLFMAGIKRRSFDRKPI